MPSPFPGMDPYLEKPGLWRDVHLELISGIRFELNAQIQPKFYARVEERVYVEKGIDPERSRWVPDVIIVPQPERGQDPVRIKIGPVESEVGGVAVAEPVTTMTWDEEEVHEAYLVIFERENREAVAVIEVVSPPNKARGGPGRKSFERKRFEVMNSSCHWIEIDLLRGGTPFTSIPATYRPYEYFIHVSRHGQRPEGLVWPIRLSQRLPIIPIPLKSGDDDARLDLQAVLATAYDRARYDLEIDYRQEPNPPLEGEWAAWSDRWLREKGVR